MSTVKTKPQEVNSQNFNQNYDDVPYDVYTFESNTPENLQAIATLFGVKAPNIKNARILELGCAYGMNLFRFAKEYPDSYSLGIDLSKTQIEIGKKYANELGLKNLELKAMSVTDLDESYGKFDYIVCHGVFSWVPEFVQEAILKVSKDLLVENGLAFISYNVLPGWNMMRTVREFAQFHADNFGDTAEKIQQGKLALKFLSDSLEGQDTPYAKFMHQFSNMILNQGNSYFYHEYLCDENKQFYFHEFIKMASKHNLQYLSDTDLPKMFVGNLPKEAANKLYAIKDIVKTEQYIDYIINTSFRSTILCHNNVQINRNINLDKMKNFFFNSIVSPQKQLSEIDINNQSEPLTFFFNYNQNISISVSDSITKAILYTFAENINNPISLDEIKKQVGAKLKTVSHEDISNSFGNIAGRLIFSGYLKIFSTKPHYIYKITDKPKVNDLTLLRAKHYDMRSGEKFNIVNQINQTITFEPHLSHIVMLLDGKHTIKDIEKNILDKIKFGIISAKDKSGNDITDDKQLEALVSNLVVNILNNLRTNYGLVA